MQHHSSLSGVARLREIVDLAHRIEGEEGAAADQALIQESKAARILAAVAIVAEHDDIVRGHDHRLSVRGPGVARRLCDIGLIDRFAVDEDLPASDEYRLSGEGDDPLNEWYSLP